MLNLPTRFLFDSRCIQDQMRGGNCVDKPPDQPTPKINHSTTEVTPSKPARLIKLTIQKDEPNQSTNQRTQPNNNQIN